MPWTRIGLDRTEIEQWLLKEGLLGLNYRDAVREAQRQAMARDPRVFLMGEGADDPAGIYGTTKGLAQEFGKSRVLDIPIAENGLTGIAIGAALAGMRPIFIHARQDFVPMACDQLVNHAAKWHFMTGGKVNVPLVVRAVASRGWGSAAQHSQTVHPMFSTVPGLKVVQPCTPYDGKGLLLAALNDGNPVLLFEHRWTFDAVGYVPEEEYEVPIGKGIVRREGSDVTIVAMSVMVYEAMRAADRLAREGLSVEIVEPRTLVPLDESLIIASVKKTRRLVIAEPACRTMSFGAEIVCRIAEHEPGILVAPVQRVCFPDLPVPAAAPLEKAYFPGAEAICAAVVAVKNHGAATNPAR